MKLNNAEFISSQLLPKEIIRFLILSQHFHDMQEVLKKIPVYQNQQDQYTGIRSR